jgi:hypothetical protein
MAADSGGPEQIKNVEVMGPVPPTGRPEDDNFSRGVGEDADLIFTQAMCDRQPNDRLGLQRLGRWLPTR